MNQKKITEVHTSDEKRKQCLSELKVFKQQFEHSNRNIDYDWKKSDIKDLKHNKTFQQKVHEKKN